MAWTDCTARMWRLTEREEDRLIKHCVQRRRVNNGSRCSGVQRFLTGTDGADEGLWRGRDVYDERCERVHTATSRLAWRDALCQRTKFLWPAHFIDPTVSTLVAIFPTALQPLSRGRSSLAATHARIVLERKNIGCPKRTA